MSEELKNQIYERDLKIQALLERISNITTSYENQVADLRVALTVLERAQQQEQARLEQQKLQEMTNVLEEKESTTEDNSED